MTKSYRTVKITRNIIAVASITEEVGDWSAYADKYNSDRFSEIERVAKMGNKIRKDVAFVLFPIVSKNFVWRD